MRCMRKRPCRATNPATCAFHLKEPEQPVTGASKGLTTVFSQPSSKVKQQVAPILPISELKQPIGEIENNLVTLFKQIQHRSHLSTGSGGNGIGKTFEDLLGKPVDNLSLPDFEGVIELKARDIASSSKITLFTKSLVLLDAVSNPDLSSAKINSFLFNTFGYTGKNGNQSLCISLSTQSVTYPLGGDYGFSLVMNHERQAVELQIFSKSSQALVFQGAGWTFSQLISSSNAKLRNLALISANIERRNGQTYYQYKQLDMIDGINGNTFIEALTNGTIAVEMRITTNSKNVMKDRGTAFRISEGKLLSIYSVRNLA